MAEDTYACRVCPNKIKVQTFSLTDKTVPTCHERPMLPSGFATDFGIPGGSQRMASSAPNEMELAAEKALQGKKPAWLQEMLQEEAGIE